MALPQFVEWAAESAGSQNKLTLKFSALSDIVRESAYYKDENLNLSIAKRLKKQ